MIIRSKPAVSQGNDLFKLIIAPIIVALLVGGTAPWWWQAFFAEESEPIVVEPVQPSPEPEPGYDDPEIPPEIPEPQTTSIQVLYRGDYFYCTINADIIIGGKQAVFMQQNQSVVNNIETGNQLYSISGQVSCPQSGSCLLGGQGNIDVVENGSYYLVWQGGTGTGQCVAALDS